MPAQRYKWRIWCTTDARYEYVVSATSPTVCPVNAGHSVDLALVVITGERKQVPFGFTLPKETVGSATAQLVNDRPAVSFSTGVDAYGAIALLWPFETDPDAKLTLCFKIIVAASGSGANVVMEAKAKREAAGQDSGGAFSVSGTTTIAVTHANPGDTFAGEIDLDASAFAKDDSVAIQIGRKGTDAADVVDVTAHMIAVEGVYP